MSVLVMALASCWGRWCPLLRFLVSWVLLLRPEVTFPSIGTEGWNQFPNRIFFRKGQRRDCFLFRPGPIFLSRLRRSRGSREVETNTWSTREFFLGLRRFLRLGNYFQLLNPLVRHCQRLLIFRTLLLPLTCELCLDLL